MSDGPQSLMDWVHYLHTAAQIKPDSPDYKDAREAVAQALRHIHALNVGATMMGANADQEVGALPATVGGLLHGGSLGVGELAAGVNEIPDLFNPKGKGFAAGAQTYREALDAAEAAHPLLTATAETVGSAAVPGGAGARTAARGIKAGVPLTIRTGALRLARGGATGAVPSTIAGFAEGGPDLGGRLRAARDAGILGFALGTAGAGIAMPRTRFHVERVADIADKGERRALTASRLEESRARVAKLRGHAPGGDPDALLRAQLLQGGQVNPENLDAAVAAIQRARAPRATELPIRGTVEAGPLEPIPNTEVRGFTAEGPPTPPAPIEVTPGMREAERLAFERADRLERPPFGAAPEGGVEVLERAGRRPISVPIDRRYAESIQRPAGTFSDPIAEQMAKDVVRSTRAGRAAARVVPAARTQRAAPRTRMQSAASGAEERARQQLASLSLEQLRQARAVTSNDPQLLALIREELAKRGKP